MCQISRRNLRPTKNKPKKGSRKTKKFVRVSKRTSRRKRKLKLREKLSKHTVRAEGAGFAAKLITRSFTGPKKSSVEPIDVRL